MTPFYTIQLSKLFTRKLCIKKRSSTYLTLVSFAAVFRDVTQRFLERGALRDILKDGFEGFHLCWIPNFRVPPLHWHSTTLSLETKPFKSFLSTSIFYFEETFLESCVGYQPSPWFCLLSPISATKHKFNFWELVHFATVFVCFLLCIV